MTFRVDPAAMSGTYDTTDTAGPSARYGKVEDTTRAFDIARAQDAATDDGDPDIPHEPAG
jgi:hypothetical protein